VQQASSVIRQLAAGISFLGTTCRLCHHDLKMFNVAIDKQPDGSLKATIFDFGTTFPCDYIHEEVYGTNAYHPWEVAVESDLCHGPAPTDESVQELRDFFGDLKEMYPKDAWTNLVMKRSARQDYPHGSCDIFGVGTMFAELLYGIEDRAFDTYNQWRFLLFPMGEMEVKRKLLNSIDPEQHPMDDCQSELRGIMENRCQHNDLFNEVMDIAFSFGAGELIVESLAKSPTRRLSPKQVYEHPYFRVLNQ